MITIYVGGIGSGKTASAVRQIMRSEDGRKTYSNIQMIDVPNNVVINRNMLLTEEAVTAIVNGRPKTKNKTVFNKEYWKKVIEEEKSINVCIDEAHTIFNSRRSQSAVNVAMTDFLAMLRRVIGSTEAGTGELILITQLLRRLDPVIREMANRVIYHRCHYDLVCQKCQARYKETNDRWNKRTGCDYCEDVTIKDMKREKFIIEVWWFGGEQDFYLWYDLRKKTYLRHFIVTDIESVFPHYNTLQWDDLFSA